MRKFAAVALTILWLGVAGCGVVYQATSGYRADRMEKTLQPGTGMPEVHKAWGEPDIRNFVDQHVEVWSYAKHANSGDVTAAVLYTSAKEGDKGTFLDLKFNDGKLVSWNEASHTMPKKEGSGFSAGFGGSPQSGTVHY